MVKYFKRYGKEPIMRSILKSIFKNKSLLFIITVLMFSFLPAGCKNGGDTNQVDNTPKG
jgi:hypothetical protein